MRLIDADALIKIALEYDDNMVDVRDIMDASTIDAVPVVRCKECKMWNTEWNHEAGDCYCYNFFQFTDPDFFCAAGERRDTDG